MAPDPRQTTEHLQATAVGQSTEPDPAAALSTRVPDDYDPYATRLPTPAEEARQYASSTTGRELPLIPGHRDLVEIGRGGMGVVYRATQTALNRLVAIKMILAGQHASREVLERFRTEAEAVARLQHPNIVQIHQIDYYHTAAGTLCPYMILEFADHGSLEHKLAGKPMDPRNAAELVEILARAMAVAHGEGIIHRDLKPANILLQASERSGIRTVVTQSALKQAVAKLEAASTQPRSAFPANRGFRFAGLIPKISDFGLAKHDGSDLTASGAIMGTPAYMSPEQASGHKDLGTLTDVYALGAVLYECLTGRPPFLGATPIGTLDLVRHQEPVPPRRLQPAVPLDLDTICLKCLQKTPKDRYASAHVLADDLRRFLQGEAISIRPPTTMERALRWSRKHPLRLTLIVALALLTVALGILLIQQQRLASERRIRDVERELEHERDLRADQLLAAWKGGMDGLHDTFEVANRADLRDYQERQLLFGKFIEMYKKLLDDGRLQNETLARGEGFVRLGMMCKKVGQNKDALDAMETGRKLLLEAAAQPSEKRALGKATRELGVLYRDARQIERRLDKAQTCFSEAATLLGELCAAAPDDLESRNELAEVHHQQGELASLRGLTRAAESSFQKAIRLREDLLAKVNEAPSDPAKQKKLAGYRKDLGRSHGYMGDTQRQLDKTNDARCSYESSLVIRKQLSEDFPKDKDARFQLARGHENMGNLHAVQDRPEASIQHFTEARDIMTQLLKGNEGYAEYQADLVRFENTLALVRASQDQLPEARQLLEDALGRLRSLEQNPEANALGTHAALAWTLAHQARCTTEPGSRPELLTQALQQLKELEGSERQQPSDAYVAALIYLLQAQEAGQDRTALSERARTCLMQALERGFSYVPQLRRDPLFKGLLDDPMLRAALSERGIK